MRNTFQILFAMTFICLTTTATAMENPAPKTTYLIPRDAIIYLAGYCQPKEKNILMRLCKECCAALKDRGRILLTNPNTVSFFDKGYALFKYTYENNIPMMQFLLENGGGNCKNFLGMYPYHIASERRYTQAAALLCTYGADSNILKPKIHLLHEAVFLGDIGWVNELLAQKVDPNIATEEGKTPIIIAAGCGHAEIVASLLYWGADPNRSSKTGCSALDVTSCYGHTNIVELLLNAGALTTLPGCNAALWRASKYGYADIIRLLLKYKANVDEVGGEDQETPLHAAACLVDTYPLQLLLAAKPNVNALNKWNNTPLIYTATRGRMITMQLLINAGVNINQVGACGWTALAYACCSGAIKIVNLLLERGANIHLALNTDSQGYPTLKKGDGPLQIAEKQGHLEVVKILQEYSERGLKLKHEEKLRRKANAKKSRGHRSFFK